MRILANDGIDPIGKNMLEEAGFTVDTHHLTAEALYEQLNTYDAITVRSATQLPKELIDAAPNLKLIGRGGVGMDNIDVAYARSRGIQVVNTPAASSLSVAELVFAHLFSGVRFLHDAHRRMPLEGEVAFSKLKKAYSGGTELRGKTLGVVGFGRIGQEVARIAWGLGMQVMVYDLLDVPATLPVTFAGGITVEFPVLKKELAVLFKEADFITMHVPFSDKPILGPEEFALLKPGVGLVNTARGGIIDEEALLDALDRGQVAFAGLDVFKGEPKPHISLLKHPKISLSPHIGAATSEAQARVGVELASLIIEYFTEKSSDGSLGVSLADLSAAD